MSIHASAARVAAAAAPGLVCIMRNRVKRSRESARENIEREVPSSSALAPTRVSRCAVIAELLKTVDLLVSIRSVFSSREMSPGQQLRPPRPPVSPPRNSLSSVSLE